MGGVCRAPGPIGSDPPESGDDGIVGVLRNLEKRIEALDQTKKIKLDFAKAGDDIVKILEDIYRSPGAPPKIDSNATDLTSDRLPPNVESAHSHPQPKVGGGIKDPSCEIRLGDVKLDIDHKTLSVSGKAKATIEIPTEFPAQFDSPTELAVKITSASVSPAQVRAVGSITVAKIFHGDMKLQIHFNDRELILAVARLANQRGLTRPQVEQLLSSMSFDASAVLKAGFLPLTYLKMSASSVLPLRHSLLGATDDVLPAQISTLPDRKVLIAGIQAVQKGVFFDVPAPALGFHYSNYGASKGFMVTAAALGIPELPKLSVQLLGYVDLHYSRRVSKGVDLDFGMTYTYAAGSPAADTDPLQLEMLHAESKSWLPTSQENQPPAADHSGHSFLFTVKGTFDGL